MKRIIILLAVIGAALFSSCEGPEGVPGQDGQDGLIAEVIEIENVSFTSSNSFSIIKPYGFDLFDSDVVLVYRLAGVNSGTDIWKLIPETRYFPDGTLDFRYDFDFTKFDVNIFMYGGNLGTVPNEFRLNQIFRIVIVPGAFINAIDKNNYGAVINALNVDENQIQKITF